MPMNKADKNVKMYACKKRHEQLQQAEARPRPAR